MEPVVTAATATAWRERTRPSLSLQIAERKSLMVLGDVLLLNAAVLAALWPASYAARLEPAEAMRA